MTKTNQIYKSNRNKSYVNISNVTDKPINDYVTEKQKEEEFQKFVLKNPDYAYDIETCIFCLTLDFHSYNQYREYILTVVKPEIEDPFNDPTYFHDHEEEFYKLNGWVN